MSKNPLIIPIAAQALVVSRENHFKKVKLNNQLSSGVNMLGKDIQFNLDRCFTDKGFIKKGIHIHWNIPKLFKHGISTNGAMDFPVVPNRWVVVRLMQQDNTTIESKSWIIKSDEIVRGNKNWVELKDDQKLDFVKIGRTEEITGKINDNVKAKIEKLTAINPINPFYSNVYDECENVFGFYDDVKLPADPKTSYPDNTTFTYIVAGWFSESTNDPLQNEKLEDLRRNILQFWRTEDDHTALDLSQFDACLFHTQIFNVEWKSNVLSGVHPGDVKISIGNTTAEALSALIVNQRNDVPEYMEDYLNALQHKMLDDQTEGALPDRHEVERESHKQSFNIKKGDGFWELRNVAQKQHISQVQEGVENVKKNGEMPYFPNDFTLVQQLKELNFDQEKHTEKSYKLNSLQQLYYFKWYKNVEDKNLYEEDQVAADEIESIKKELAGLMEEMGKKKDAIEKLIHEKYSAIHPTTQKAEPIYELVHSSGNAFWEPNDPAVLFYGDGLGDVTNFHLDITDKLACRSSREVMDQLDFTFTHASGQKETITIHSSDVDVKMVDLNGGSFNHGEIFGRLVKESALLSPNFFDYFHKGLQHRNVNVQKDEFYQAQKQWIESHLKFTRPKHKQAWEPLFLLWKVVVKASEKNTEDIVCQGFTPITTGARESIREYSEKTAERYSKLLGQSLSGFNKQLIAQLPSLQLPPLKYDYDEEDEIESSEIVDHEMLDLIGLEDAYRLAPRIESNRSKAFNPLRKGSLIIEHLSLIDTFGQEKIIVTNGTKKGASDFFVSKSLKSGHNGEMASISLNPRIIQPSRLEWSWINDLGEKVFQDSGILDHPIIGWIVPNYVDRLLLIYDRNGREIMGLRVGKSGKNVEEFHPIDEEANERDLASERRKSLQEPLKSILASLNIDEFINKCEAIREITQNNQGIQAYNPVHLLYGKPIAIAKGQLVLETQGPVIHNSLNDFDTDYLTSLTIPVLLGASDQKNNGLVAYYVDNNYGQLEYTDFTAKKTVDLKLNEPKDITVLLMAGTEFSIDSNHWLPYKKVGLFSNAVDELTKQLKVSFLLCPMIIDSKLNQILTPNLGANKWDWIHKSGVNTWQKPKEANSPNMDNHNFNPLHIVEGWVRMNDVNQTKH